MNAEKMTILDYFAAHAPETPQWWFDHIEFKGTHEEKVARDKKMRLAWPWAWAKAVLEAKEAGGVK
jgi:hypothetical protein